MATGVQWLKSTDTSAPILTGQTGSLTTLLDALLKDGYGSKSAMGTGGAGAWAKSFTGTSKAAYRPSAGNRFYMRIQDDGPGAGTFKEARIVGYETMSDVDTGTNPMPTVAQAANGLFIRKSAAADSTARVWKALGDDRTFYLFVQSGDTASVYVGFGWGDFYSHLTGDGYRIFLIARSTENSATVIISPENFPLLRGSSFTTAENGHYIQRNRSAAVGAIAVNKTNVVGGLGTSTSIEGPGNIAYPNAEDGGLYLLPLYLNDVASASKSVRGRLRGLWVTPFTATGFTDAQTFSGVGDYAGKTFEIVKGWQSATTGALVVETSDTWDTSS